MNLPSITMANLKIVENGGTLSYSMINAELQELKLILSQSQSTSYRKSLLRLIDNLEFDVQLLKPTN